VSRPGKGGKKGRRATWPTRERFPLPRHPPKQGKGKKTRRRARPAKQSAARKRRAKGGLRPGAAPADKHARGREPAEKEGGGKQTEQKQRAQAKARQGRHPKGERRMCPERDLAKFSGFSGGGTRENCVSQPQIAAVGATGGNTVPNRLPGENRLPA